MKLTPGKEKDENDFQLKYFFIVIQYVSGILGVNLVEEES